MLVAELDEKASPLIGFALGIELSQVVIVLLVLLLVYVGQTILMVKQSLFVSVVSTIIILITIPLLYDTFPW